MDLLPRMGDVHVVFGILTRCFMQHPSYLLQCTPSFSTFTKFVISFDFSLFQIFGCLLGPRSFDSLEKPLVRKQTSLPIIFNGIKFISTFNIAPTTYFKSWALVASIIAIKFMVDQHHFLLEVLTQVNNNSFPFQQHLKVTCDLLPPPTCACFLPFEKLIGQ